MREGMEWERFERVLGGISVGLSGKRNSFEGVKDFEVKSCWIELRSDLNSIEDLEDILDLILIE